MNHFKTLTLSSAIVALGLSPACADDDTGGYIGISANRLSVDNVETTDTDFEDSDTAFGAKVGYMFTDMFGIEGGYLDLGDYETRGQEEGRNLSLDAEGWYLAGVLNFSLAENFDLYGKLGAFSVDSNSDFTDFEESSTEVFGGVGAEYDLGAVNLFGEFNVIDTDIADINWDVISLGIKYEFGGY
jgi:hypothetical protein